MSEGAECSVFTVADIVRIEGAKFSFIFLRPVELLHSIMAFRAIISKQTHFASFSIFAHIARIEIPRTLSVFIIMIKRAVLMVMLTVFSARFKLKVD